MRQYCGICSRRAANIPKRNVLYEENPEKTDCLSVEFDEREIVMAQSSWRILPKSMPGKWSVALIVAMPVLFLIGTSFASSYYESVPAGDTLLADIAARPALALTMLAGMISGIAAFITGLLAVVRQKETALLVYASTLVGALVTLFLAGQIIFPS